MSIDESLRKSGLAVFGSRMSVAKWAAFLSRHRCSLRQTFSRVIISCQPIASSLVAGDCLKPDSQLSTDEIRSACGIRDDTIAHEGDSV